MCFHLGAVHKIRLQEEGGRWLKKSSFCKLSYHKICKRKGVGDQKKTNAVNVACERPPIEMNQISYQYAYSSQRVYLAYCSNLNYQINVALK